MHSAILLAYYEQRCDHSTKCYEKYHNSLLLLLFTRDTNNSSALPESAPVVRPSVGAAKRIGKNITSGKALVCSVILQSSVFGVL